MRKFIPSLLTIAFAAAGAFVLLPATTVTAFFKTPASNEIATFAKDVAPIVFKNCAECHRPGEAAPMSLLTYKDARPWAKSIREKVVNRQMPPWHADPRHGEFRNDRRLTEAEIATIVNWVDNGAKEGDARHLPPAPTFAEGWGIGQPDLVLQMPEEFTLEASGPDEYQNFEIATNFNEDRWVQAVEARPGNRRIVHHILALIKPPADPNAPKLTKEEADKQRALQEKESIYYREGFLQRVKADAPVHNNGCELPNGGSGRQFDTSKRHTLPPVLTLFAPGRDVNNWEPGTARLIPAGSKLTLQVHYSKATGKVEKDRSSIGIVFAKAPPSRVLMSEMVHNSYLKIDPGAERHRVTACWTTPKEFQLTAIMPHMHMRGAAMEVKLVYPEGRSEVVLNVPSYDFAWQTNYSLKRPLTVPKGATFLITGHFDNSSKNRYNPDPLKAVRWGEPTYDEMLACFFEYTQESKQALVATR